MTRRNTTGSCNKTGRYRPICTVCLERCCTSMRCRDSEAVACAACSLRGSWMPSWCNQTIASKVPVFSYSPHFFSHHFVFIKEPWSTAALVIFQFLIFLVIVLPINLRVKGEIVLYLNPYRQTETLILCIKRSFFLLLQLHYGARWNNRIAFNCFCLNFAPWRIVDLWNTQPNSCTGLSLDWLQPALMRDT